LFRCENRGEPPDHFPSPIRGPVGVEKHGTLPGHSRAFHVVGGPFAFPAGSKTVKVSCLRGGKPVTEDVPIQIVKSVAAPTAAVAAVTPVVDTARGFSDTFSFDEAFRNAIANLPNRPPSHPDELS